MSVDVSLASRISRLQPSATIAVSTKAKELKRAGKDVINLGTGEPDFDTPEHIKEAARQAMADGQTKYTAVPGTLECRESICRKMARDNGLSYSPEQIVVSCGAKHGIMNLMQCVVEEGDQVVIPAPCWVSYPDMVSFCGGVSRIITAPAGDDYKITAPQLREALSPKTKMVILNSPCNPSGAVYSSEELAKLGEVIAEHPSAIVCSDEIYEHIVYGSSSATSFLQACPDLADRTVIVNGVSKAYAMTGWRIGFTASNPKLAKAMTTIQSQTTSSVCSISQAAAIAAFDTDLEFIKPMLEAFSARRSRVVNACAKIDGLVLPPIDGAFYAFPDAQAMMERLHDAGKLDTADDQALCQMLLEKHLIAAVPGKAFQAPGSFRISFAADDELIDKALSRLSTALQ